MGLPINYRKSSEGVIASYDFFDFAARVGYKRFYGLRNNEGDRLIVSAIDSNSTNTAVTDGGATIYFDIMFNSPNGVYGSAFFSALYSVYNSTGNPKTSLTIEPFKVNIDTTTTSLATAITTDEITGGGTIAYKRCGAIIEIPKTHFKKGEKLRLKVILNRTGDTSGQRILYHNPMNVTVGGYSTTLLFDVPFLVDL